MSGETYEFSKVMEAFKEKFPNLSEETVAYLGDQLENKLSERLLTPREIGTRSEEFLKKISLDSNPEPSESQ